MHSSNSLDDLRRFIRSQPFDPQLPEYKSILFPEDKILYEKGPTLVTYWTGKPANMNI